MKKQNLKKQEKKQKRMAYNDKIVNNDILLFFIDL